VWRGKNSPLPLAGEGALAARQQTTSQVPTVSAFLNAGLQVEVHVLAAA
jgi:hypothetical protein